MKKWKKHLKNEKGFSLIEMLIVIAILALLASLIIPRLTTSLDEAENTTNEANIKLVQSAVERYYFDKKEYPTTDKSNGGSSGVAIDMKALVDGGYIDKAPDGHTYTLKNGVVE